VLVVKKSRAWMLQGLEAATVRSTRHIHWSLQALLVVSRGCLDSLELFWAGGIPTEIWELLRNTALFGLRSPLKTGERGAAEKYPEREHRCRACSRRKAH
jgi:hypothetical protein